MTESTHPEFTPQPVIDNIDERVTLSLTPENANGDTISKLWGLCKKHHGPTEVWLRIDTGVKAAQMKVSPMFWVQTTDEFVQAASELLGQDNVRLPLESGINAAI